MGKAAETKNENVFDPFGDQLQDLTPISRDSLYGDARFAFGTGDDRDYLDGGTANDDQWRRAA